MSIVEKLLTAEEFACLPDAEEGGKMELVRGKVMVMAPPGGEHAKRSGRIAGFLDAFARSRGLGHALGEAGFWTRRNPDVVRVPDAAFIARERLPGGLPAGFIEGAPTLAVEVISPNDRDSEVQAKVLEYLAAGSERVWVVRPETKTVTVHRPDGTARTLALDGTLMSDDAAFGVDGFELPLEELFGD
jgi:Uma2 family endonuclease